MKRRITSMLLAAAMTITMLTGCGSQGKETEKTDTGAIVLDMYHSWSTDSERGAGCSCSAYFLLPGQNYSE